MVKRIIMRKVPCRLKEVQKEIDRPLSVKSVHAHTNYKVTIEHSSVNFKFRTNYLELGERIELLRKTVSGIVLMLLLTSMLSSAFIIQPVKAEPTTIIVPDDYPTIQEAINAANPGDFIFVYNGTYYENVVVNKTLSLIGENRYSTIIDGNETGSAIRIVANNVTVSEFTLEGGRGFQRSGISIGSSSDANVSWNVMKDNWAGIWLSGSINALLIGNLVTNNEEIGITLDGCSNAVLRSNNITNNTVNFGVWGGSSLDYFIHDIDTSNTVNGKPIYYLINQQNIVVDPYTFTDVGYLAVINSTNVIVKNLTFTNNQQGILVAHTTNSTVEKIKAANNWVGVWLAYSKGNDLIGNTITKNYWEGVWSQYSNSSHISDNNITANRIAGLYLICSHGNNIKLNTVGSQKGAGIALGSSDNNMITRNAIKDNEEAGVFLDMANNNTFYHNNIINNTEQVNVYESYDNVWDDGYPSGGNYWSDYQERYPDAEELDDSGIWDHPYVIDDYNRDRYPLMKPWTPTPEVGIEITQPRVGDIFWIEAEPEPKMPTIICQAKVLGVTPDPTATTEFLWEAIITYTDHGRNDIHKFGPQKVLGGMWNLDFKNVIAGGTLTVKVTAVINGKEYQDSVTGYIRGKNPDKETVKEALGKLILQVICYKESYPKWHQFDDLGLPVFGPPGGFGLMQLDTPPPTSQQIWSWLENFKGGKRLWLEKLAMSKNYVKRVREANSDQKVSNLSPEEHERQAAYLYRGAAWVDGEWQYYYVWNRNTKQWEVNPKADAVSKAYADDAMNIKAAVLAGNEPPGW